MFAKAMFSHALMNLANWASNATVWTVKMTRNLLSRKLVRTTCSYASELRETLEDIVGIVDTAWKWYIAIWELMAGLYLLLEEKIMLRKKSLKNDE